MRNLFEKLSTSDACCLVSCSINARNRPSASMLILASSMYAIPNFSFKNWLVPRHFSSPFISTPILSQTASASSIEVVVNTADLPLADSSCFIVFQNCRLQFGSIPDVGSFVLRKISCKRKAKRRCRTNLALTTIEKNKLGSGEYGEGECKFSFNVHTKIFCEGVNVLFKVQTFDDSDSKIAVSKIGYLKVRQRTGRLTLCICAGHQSRQSSWLTHRTLNARRESDRPRTSPVECKRRFGRGTGADCRCLCQHSPTWFGLFLATPHLWLV